MFKRKSMIWTMIIIFIAFSYFLASCSKKPEKKPAPKDQIKEKTE